MSSAPPTATAAETTTPEFGKIDQDISRTRADEEEERRRLWEQEDADEGEVWREARLRQESFVEEPELSKEEEMELLEGEYKRALKQVCTLVVCSNNNG